MKNKYIIIGTATTAWPFIALLLFAALSNTIWNELNTTASVQLLVRVAIAAAWTGTIPLTLYFWNRIMRGRHPIPRILAIGLINIAFTTAYYGALYVFFLAVAIGFDHIPI